MNKHCNYHNDWHQYAHNQGVQLCCTPTRHGIDGCSKPGGMLYIPLLGKVSSTASNLQQLLSYEMPWRALYICTCHPNWLECRLSFESLVILSLHDFVEGAMDTGDTAWHLQNLLIGGQKLCSGNKHLQLGENKRAGWVLFCNYRNSRRRTLQLVIDASQAASVVTILLQEASLDAHVVHRPPAHGTITQWSCLALEARIQNVLHRMFRQLSLRCMDWLNCATWQKKSFYIMSRKCVWGEVRALPVQP